MVTSEDVIEIHTLLSENNIEMWLTGGWGIDALLNKQTRQHKDIDIIILLKDIEKILEVLGKIQYTTKEIWSENKWVPGIILQQIPTAFVLWDRQKREIDIHAIKFDEREIGIPAWNDNEGLLFSKEDLSYQGNIAGVVINCISPKTQERTHKGYDLPEYQIIDMKLLLEEYKDLR